MLNEIHHTSSLPPLFAVLAAWVVRFRVRDIVGIGHKKIWPVALVQCPNTLRWMEAGHPGALHWFISQELCRCSVSLTNSINCLKPHKIPLVVYRWMRNCLNVCASPEKCQSLAFSDGEHTQLDTCSKADPVVHQVECFSW